MNDIGVLVVTFNQVGILTQWLHNFYRLFGEKRNIYLLILDNNSTDSTYDLIKKEFPAVEIRKLNRNYGCTTGRNIGISLLDKIGCEFYASFDADVFVYDAEYFDKFLTAMRKDTLASGFCPILRWYEDGSIQGMGARRGWHGGLITVNSITSDNHVDCLPGGANFIRMAAFKKYGFYDNDLPPIGSQDYEWGLRASKLGAKFYYLPYAEAIHHHQKNSTCSPWTKEWVIEGRAVLLRKHPSLGNVIREILYFIFHHRFYGLKPMLNSYYKGFTKRLNKNNYLFNNFNSLGIERFFAEDYFTDRSMRYD